MALNLEKQLVFYGSYHHNPVNIAIHITCVPMILMSFFCLFTNTPSLPIPQWLQIPYLPPNLGIVLAFLYGAGYMLMEPVAGGALALLILAGTAYCNHLTHSPVASTTNTWALAMNITSWIAQFIGHGKFEGRTPALLDNLVQALFLAPFFVWLEVLFSVGYRPELKARVDKMVEEKVRQFRLEKEKKGVNGHANGGAKKEI